MDSIAILDFGSQTAQLIARRLREAHVYCELFPHDAAQDSVMALRPKGFILSGGPSSVYEPHAPQIPIYVLDSGLPLLGICYGMQALTHSLGGRVAAARTREYGPAEIEVPNGGGLLRKGRHPVWMSHGDRIDQLPEGFQVLASSTNAPYAAMGNPEFKRYGLQFHPEVQHTPDGFEILRSFAVEVCGAGADWTPEAMIPTAIARIQSQVGAGRAIAAVSGGVDSAVAAVLADRALGKQLSPVFINTGLLRAGEASRVGLSLGSLFDNRLSIVDASASFLEALAGITDPETKRRVIGEQFIRVLEREADRQGHQADYLIQGTIYPDVVESSGPDRRTAARIKTHHNVGGLPEQMGFELVEPLRFLFKDEVRALGKRLGVPNELLLGQPFPGPGLAVRCLGEVSPDRLERLRAADRILIDELTVAGLLLADTAQAFAVLLPIRTVGVMGDQRTYAETVALRAVTTEDFMTADWARLPHEVLAQVSRRIVNEVPGVNRVVYDITSKPPATIEWE
jgi:GMP synthase (glutamine-hydrolysing)